MSITLNEFIKSSVGLLYSVFELFFPQACASCLSYGECMGWGRALCNRCDYLLRYSMTQIHQPVSRFSQPEVRAASVYTHEIARCILAFKNAGRTDLVPYFSTGLVRACITLLESVGFDSEREYGGQNKRPHLLIVPMPSSVRATHRRGFVPADLLSTGVVRKLRGTSLRESFDIRIAHLLKHRGMLGSRSGQKLLGVSARRRRTEDSIRLKNNWIEFLGVTSESNGKLCILLDDVMTTGATLHASGKLLESAGYTVLGAVTVAAVPRRLDSGREF